MKPLSHHTRLVCSCVRVCAGMWCVCVYVSGVAFWSSEDAWPEVVTHHTTKARTTPSAVFYGDSETPVVGAAAVEAAARDAGHLVTNFKRLVGRR